MSSSKGYNSKYKSYGFAPLLVIVFLFVAVGLVATGYFLGTNKLTPVITNQPSPSDDANASPGSTIQPVTGKPEKNTLYLGTMGNETVLFLLANYETSNPEYIGSVTYADGRGEGNIDFRDIEEPKLIWESSSVQRIEGPTSFVIQGNTMYTSVILAEINTDNYSYPWSNTIVRINLSTGASKDIWNHRFGLGNYDQASGAAYTLRLSGDGKYLAMEMAVCYACDGGLAGTLIINTETMQEKYLPMIGNLEFNTSNDTFSYQKLAPFKEACGPGEEYGCDENREREVMKPAGETITEQLP